MDPQITLSYLQQSRQYLTQYIDNLEQAQQAALPLSNLLFAAVAYVRYMVALQTIANQNIVHVACNLNDSANARSHPSFYGAALAEFEEGTVFTNYEERGDSPTDPNVPPATWVRITEYGAFENGNTLWIRRIYISTDPNDPVNQTILIDRSSYPCHPIEPDFINVVRPDEDELEFSYSDPGCTQSGTCLTGTESAEYQVQ